MEILSEEGIMSYLFTYVINLRVSVETLSLRNFSPSAIS